MHKDYYYLGKITRTHGLAGNLILKLDTDQPEFYEKLGSLFIEINGLLAPFFVEKQQWSKDSSKIVSLKNVPLQMAEQMVNCAVYLPLDTLPELEGKQFYYHEVTGFRILDEDGRLCGTIKDVNDSAPQHYFILDLDKKEIIIPVIKDWITSVNREEKTIRMQLPEGLLEVFEN